MPKLQSYRMGDYLKLKKMESLSFIPIVSKGVETKIYILDPSIWEFLDRNKVNEVEFVNCSFYDARKSDRSLDGYKSIVDIDYQFLFNETKRHRYFESIITSIRIVGNEKMKAMTYGGENKLKYKGSCEEDVTDIIKSNFELKDERLQEIDNAYQKRDKKKKK